MEQNLVAVKIGYNGELHRQRVNINTLTLSTLQMLFTQTFHLVPGSFVIRYKDADDDLLNVVSEAEFIEACRVFSSGKEEGQRTLKFTAELRGDADQSASVNPSAPAMPLVEAVDRLAQSLNVTLEKLTAEEWSGLEGASEELGQAARDAHQTLETARRSAHDKPLEQVLEDTSAGLTSAARGISVFAQRLVSSFIPDKKAQAAAAARAAQEQSNQAELRDAPVETAPPAPIVQAESTQVEPPVNIPPPAAAAPEVSVPAPVEPPASIAFSDAEAKWAEQLTTIRAVLPDIDVSLAVSVLERTDGNVEVSVNHLMEHV